MCIICAYEACLNSEVCPSQRVLGSSKERPVEVFAKWFARYQQQTVETKRDIDHAVRMVLNERDPSDEQKVQLAATIVGYLLPSQNSDARAEVLVFAEYLDGYNLCTESDQESVQDLVRIILGENTGQDRGLAIDDLWETLFPEIEANKLVLLI